MSFIVDQNLEVYGNIKGTIDNLTGQVVTYNVATKTLGTRTNAQILADLGLTSVVTDSHTHTNKSVLDGITAGKVTNWDTAFTRGDFRDFGLGLDTPIVETDLIATNQRTRFISWTSTTLNTPYTYGGGIVVKGNNSTNFTILTLPFQNSASQHIAYRGFQSNSAVTNWIKVWDERNLTKLSQLINDLPSQIQTLSLNTNASGGLELSNGGGNVSLNTLSLALKQDSTVRLKRHSFEPYYVSTGSVGYPSSSTSMGIRIERYSNSTSQNGFYLHRVAGQDYLWYRTFDGADVENSWKILADRDWVNSQGFIKNSDTNNYVKYGILASTTYVASDTINSQDFDLLPKGNYTANLGTTTNINGPTNIGGLRGLFRFGANHSNLSNDIVIGITGLAFRNSTNNIWRTVWTNTNLTDPATQTWVNEQGFVKTDTTYTEGTLALLNTGTSGTNMVWSPKNLTDWGLSKFYNSGNLKSKAVSASAGTDANTAFADGMGGFITSYGTSTWLANGAFTGYGGIIDWAHSSGHSLQLHYDIGHSTTDGGRIAFRTKHSTGFTVWKEFANKEWVSASYVKKSGDTMTGTLVSNTPATTPTLSKSTNSSGIILLRGSGTGYDKGLGISISGDLVYGDFSTVNNLLSTWSRIWTSGNLVDPATQTWVNLQGYSTQTLTAGNNISIVGNVISSTDTTYNVFTKIIDGLVPAPTGTTSTRFLREDGTWVVPTNSTYSVMTASEITTGTATTGRLTSAKVLNDWLNSFGYVNTDTTYTAGSGLSLSGNVFANTSPNIDQKLSISGMVITLDRSGGSLTLPSASLISSTTATGLTNVVTGNTNTFLNIIQGGTTLGSSTQVTGSGSVTVASDTSGKLTITGVDTKYTSSNGILLTDSNFTPTYGTAANTIAQGNDSRFHTHSNLTILNNTTASFTTALETKLNSLSNYILPIASTSVLGGIKVGSNLSITADGTLSSTNTNTTYSAGNGLTLSGTVFSLPITTIGTGNVITDIIQTTNGITVTKGNLDADTPLATTTTIGGFKLFSDTLQTVVSNAVTATAARTYAIQLNSAGQALVNVPWTNTTYSAGTHAQLNAGTVTTNYLWSPKILSDYINGLSFLTPSTMPDSSLVTSTTSNGTSNIVTTNSNTFLNIVTAGVSTGLSTQITGTGIITVSSDINGKITINGTNSYTAGTLAELNAITPHSNTRVWSPDILQSWVNSKLVSATTQIWEITPFQGLKVKAFTSSATGHYSIAMGMWSSSSGDIDTTIGYSSSSIGGFNNTIGNYLNSKGTRGINIGTYSTIDTSNNIAIGNSLINRTVDSIVLGNFNVDRGIVAIPNSTNTLLVVGNGTSAFDRKDAFVLYNNGELDFSGKAKYTSTIASFNGNEIPNATWVQAQIAASGGGGTGVSAGTLAQLNTGTDTTNYSWSPFNLNSWFTTKITNFVTAPDPIADYGYQHSGVNTSVITAGLDSIKISGEIWENQNTINFPEAGLGYMDTNGVWRPLGDSGNVEWEVIPTTAILGVVLPSMNKVLIRGYFHSSIGAKMAILIDIMKGRFLFAGRNGADVGNFSNAFNIETGHRLVGTLLSNKVVYFDFRMNNS